VHFVQPHLGWGSGFRVQGSGFRVQGSGISGRFGSNQSLPFFRVEGLTLRVQECLGLRVEEDVGFSVRGRQRLGFRASYFGFAFRISVSRFAFRGSGSVFGVTALKPWLEPPLKSAGFVAP